MALPRFGLALVAGLLAPAPAVSPFAAQLRRLAHGRQAVSPFAAQLRRLAHGRQAVSPFAAPLRGLAHGRQLRRLLRKKRLRPAAKAGVDCKATPVLCNAPLHCDTNSPTDAEEHHWMQKGLAADGHANLRYWCGQRSAANNLVQECIVNRDLVKSAHMVFDIQRKNGESELDASYCFLEGHCTNPQVNLNTTVAEAEHMCDERFGGRWRAWGSKASPPGDHINNAHKNVAKVTGYTSRAQTTPFVLAACAMGIYQCDVTYCKETYCKMDPYVRKYSHLLQV